MSKCCRRCCGKFTGKDKELGASSQELEIAFENGHKSGLRKGFAMSQESLDLIDAWNFDQKQSLNPSPAQTLQSRQTTYPFEHTYANDPPRIPPRLPRR